MYVCFLENAPDAKAIAAIAPYTNPEEQLQVHGSEAFVYYAGGLGKAKLTNAIIERRLGMATMRNWNTVNTLLAAVWTLNSEMLTGSGGSGDIAVAIALRKPARLAPYPDGVALY